MKASAPERIYLEKVYPDNRVLPNGLNYNQSPNDIEYTRTDAFIEKACEWLKNSTYGYLTEKWGETELDRETLAADFKKYMKGEKV